MSYTIYVCPECQRSSLDAAHHETGCSLPEPETIEVVPRSVADELADCVEAFIAATVPSVSDEWARLGEDLAKYREATK